MLRLCLALMFSGAAAGSAFAENWPAWRGPAGNGIRYREEHSCGMGRTGMWPGKWLCLVPPEQLLWSGECRFF
jgi:hypothetical protein